MEALIMMLHNLPQNTYHPILYFESFFPGGADSEGNMKLKRFKSKGHHTKGFTSRQDAVNHIQTDLEPKVKNMGYKVNVEIEEADLVWDGTEVPIDVQLRGR